MMILVIGGSGSGKSACAEKLTEQLADSVSGEQAYSALTGRAAKKYYLATMQVYDEEGQRKVERHRRLRSDKGFLTIEQPTAVRRALEKMDAGNRIVLLECVSNLTANEMFSGEKAAAETQVVETVTQDISLLNEQTTHLVVVSNNVFEDGSAYDETTMAYIRAMGKINQKLAALASQVVEVTAGIAFVVKQICR